MSLRAKDQSLVSIFPDFPRAKRILKVNSSRENYDRSIWVRSLQGLANRKEPHVWVHCAGEAEDHWFSFITEKYGIPQCGELSELEFLKEYAGLCRGYIVYDNKDVIQTQNIAITLCGLEACLPVSPEEERFAAEAGLEKIDDLRGKFADDREASFWAVENLWPRCNRRMIANLCIHRPTWYASAHDLEDYIVYNRIFCIDLPRTRAFKWSRDLYRKMMETAEAPGVMLNWHCVWEQEKEYVYEAAREGFFVLCSVETPNLTFHGAVGDPEKSYAGTQPLPPKEKCAADPNKVYVCFYNSDGDATWAMASLHSLNWLNPNRGSFKFGWGFLPLMCRIMPDMMEYYHDTKRPDDCFWGPSSGAGYTYSWAWPDDLAVKYLSDSRALLDQSGQNGCNMVNWFLQDCWREKPDAAAVAREQEILGTENCPGLVCGLGGSPYAISYPKGRVPKLHSVHIANVGADNIGDIIRFSKECPTRPAFMFLFAQISTGIFKQIESELPRLKDHPEIEMLSMDEFFVTLQDAVERGLVGDELYEKTEAMAETWLKVPAAHRLPLYVSLAEEMCDAVADEPENRLRRFSESGYTDLVSREIESVAKDRKRFTECFKMRSGAFMDQEADIIFYSLFTVAWGIVRSGIEALGVYANDRRQCIDDFERLCGGITDTGAMREIFDRWDAWEELGSPSVEESSRLCGAVLDSARKLNDALGDDSEFHKWPPKSI
ncbi:MAG: GxGYxYP family putative glycoside hydrolase [Clostridiales bacterium]|nr:GxGYxYP family putative glycoside hydrolase [Clostridiales bacterium]